jgi:membrane associated rhomboid family serine protease
MSTQRKLTIAMLYAASILNGLSCQVKLAANGPTVGALAAGAACLGLLFCAILLRQDRKAQP